MNVTDKRRQAEIYARNSALGKPGARNMEFVDPVEQSREKWIRRTDSNSPEFDYGADNYQY